jgi:GNAT superfamily N-acetyltransferase
MSCTIRLANEADVGTILLFIKGLAEYEKLSHEVVATEDDLRRTLFGKNPQAEVLIASLDEKPVGFCLFFHNYSTFLGKRGLYIEDLFVYPDIRGKGIGKELLNATARIALERNCGRMEWSVLDWNEPAIKFYRSIGAKPMDEWTVQRLLASEMKALAEG